MKQFEYLIRPDMFKGALNELGKEGWELVSVMLTNYGTPEYFFKREIEIKPNPTIVKFNLPPPQNLNEALSQENLDKINGDSRLKF